MAAVVAAFAAIGLAGVLRPAPGDSADARAAQARLNAIPLELGAWRGVGTEVPAKHLRIAEAQAHLSRTYTRPVDRAAVSVLVLAGAPGPLGAHTPQTCFSGVGYQSDGAAVEHRLPAGAGSLWLGRFSPPPPGGASCQVAWGWGDGRSWVASNDPRFEFSGRNLLYKLYVSRGVGPAAAAPGAVDEFLEVFLPAFAAAP